MKTIYAVYTRGDKVKLEEVLVEDTGKLYKPGDTKAWDNIFLTSKQMPKGKGGAQRAPFREVVYGENRDDVKAAALRMFRERFDKIDKEHTNRLAQLMSAEEIL